MNDWKCLAEAGDEWVVAYALAPELSRVQLFSAGFALELYLKAAYSKVTGSSDDIAKFGHNIPKIVAQIRVSDGDFLPALKIREDFLGRDLLSGNISDLSIEDQKSLITDIWLYLALVHLADLKYLSGPLKSSQGPRAFAFLTHDPAWSSLYREVRKYLELTEPSNFVQHVEPSGKFAASAKEFIQDALGPYK